MYLQDNFPAALQSQAVQSLQDVHLHAANIKSNNIDLGGRLTNDLAHKLNRSRFFFIVQHNN